MCSNIQVFLHIPLTFHFDLGVYDIIYLLGKPLHYMRGLYFRLKDEVFKGSRPYPSEPFEELLKKEFGDKVMTDIKHPKYVPYNVEVL